MFCEEQSCCTGVPLREERQNCFPCIYPGSVDILLLQSQSRLLAHSSSACALSKALGLNRVHLHAVINPSHHAASAGSRFGEL